MFLYTYILSIAGRKYTQLIYFPRLFYLYITIMSVNLNLYYYINMFVYYSVLLPAQTAFKWSYNIYNFIIAIYYVSYKYHDIIICFECL